MGRSCLQPQTDVLFGMFHKEFGPEFAPMAFMPGKLVFPLRLIFGQACGMAKAALEAAKSAMQGLEQPPQMAGSGERIGGRLLRSMHGALVFLVKHRKSHANGPSGAALHDHMKPGQMDVPVVGRAKGASFAFRSGALNLASQAGELENDSRQMQASFEKRIVPVNE